MTRIKLPARLRRCGDILKTALEVTGRHSPMLIRARAAGFKIDIPPATTDPVVTDATSLLITDDASDHFVSGIQDMNLPVLYGTNTSIDHVYGPVREFLMGPIAQRIMTAIEEAKSAGRTPVLVADIDDTIIDAGKRVVRFGDEWFYHRYTGRLPDKFIRTVYDPQGIQDPARMRIITVKPTDWNIVKCLQFYYKLVWLNEHYPEMVASAAEFFKQNFFDFRNWRKNERIYTTIALLREGHLRGARILFTSLRGQVDAMGADISQHATNMLKGMGVMHEGDELVLKPGESEVVNSAADASNTISKADMVMSHLEHRSLLTNIQVVATIDNDPTKLNDYYDDPRFDDSIIQVLVKTNAPEGAEDPRNPDVMEMSPRLPWRVTAWSKSALRFLFPKHDLNSMGIPTFMD